MKEMVTPAGFLGEIIEPLGKALNLESARALVEVRPSNEALLRIEQLARLRDEGRITQAELAEYELFVEVGDMVALLQARAKRYLKSQVA